MSVSNKHRLSSLRENEQRAISAFRESLDKALGANVVALKLFGSKARGRSTPASDIDLLVLVKRYAAQLEDLVIEIAFDINLEYGVYISPRVIGEATFRHPVWRSTSFLRLLAKEGIPV